MFDKDKLESAFNVTVKYGFCSDCRWEFDSEKCHQFDCYENSVKIIREAIDFALNNETVKHGHWIRRYNAVYCLEWYECSECRHDMNKKYIDNYFEDILIFPKYCEYCGAKMDGESND